MTFVSPLTAIIVAAVSIPLLVLLYVLRLRRRRMTIASTLLWPSRTEDLQVNAPFRRLRLTGLFLLQLITLLMLLLALADPLVETGVRSAPRLILLVDTSASMNARDAEGVLRLDQAKAACRDIVSRRLKGGRQASSILIIAVGARPRLVTPFETRRDVLLDWIDRIESTDEETDLDAALQLAGTFTRTTDEEGAPPPDVLFVSDGGVAPAEDGAGYTLRGGTFRFVQVGEPAGPNVGIVDLTARRDLGDPERTFVFVRLVNDGDEPATARLTVRFDGDERAVRRVTVPAADPVAGVGVATVSVEVEAAGGGVLEADLGHADPLTEDDTAAIVLPAPRRPRIRLVHPAAGPDPFLLRLLEEYEPERLRPQSAEAFFGEDQAIIDAGRSDDLVVFDRVAPRRLPGIPTLTFGGVPLGVETQDAVSLGGRRILAWSRDHPIMRHVALDTIVYSEFGAMVPPLGANVLATGPDGPAILLIPARDAEHVVVGFELAKSNWPTHVSVVVFLHNAIGELTERRSGQGSLVVRPGEPITVRRSPEATVVSVTGPNLTRRREGDPEGLVTLPGLPRVGIYDVEGVEPPHERIAVSLLSAVESDLRPRDTLRVNAVQVAGGDARDAAPRRLWPWLVAAALVMLVVEWLVYCRRVHVSS